MRTRNFFPIPGLGTCTWAWWCQFLPPPQISRPRGSKLRNSLTILKIKIRELTYISLSHKQVKNRPPPPLLSCNENLPLLLIFLEQKRRENSNSNNYGSEHARKGATPKKEKRRKRRGNNFLSPSFLSLTCVSRMMGGAPFQNVLTPQIVDENDVKHIFLGLFHDQCV